MRYHNYTVMDLDRTLEAFRWARRGLLIVTAVALPFAAWQDLGTRPVVAKEPVRQGNPVAVDSQIGCTLAGAKLVRS